MTNTTRDKVRIELQIFNENVLSDDSVDQFVDDANEDSPIDDERAKRYLASFLVAQSLKFHAVKSTGDGVTFEAPDPSVYEEKYKSRLRKLGKGIPKKTNRECTDDYLTGDRCIDKKLDPLL